MTNPTTSPVQFRMTAPLVRLEVAVELRRSGDRWVAAATVGGARHIGVGPSARAAVTAAVSPLGPATVKALLADPALVTPSLELLRQAR